MHHNGVNNGENHPSLSRESKRHPSVAPRREIREIDNGLQRAKRRDDFVLKQKLAVVKWMFAGLC